MQRSLEQWAHARCPSLLHHLIVEHHLFLVVDADAWDAVVQGERARYTDLLFQQPGLGIVTEVGTVV